MSIPFVDLNAQYNSIKLEIDHAINEVLESSCFIDGEPVAEFEREFANYIGIDHCITCANGTDSLEIILRALGIGIGDEVIVPANSWIATADAVSIVGAEPIFVDVMQEDYTIDPARIEAAITSKTKAIIPVHLFGLPARMHDIVSIANEYKLRVIEDCAQAHGASIDGKKVGTFGDVASFSFYPAKNLGAYGDAGAIITNNAQLASKIRRVGNHGQLKKHDHEILGRNSRMDTMQAAILRAKLPHLDNWLQKRNQIADHYVKSLKKISCPVSKKGYYHAFHLFVIRVKDREALLKVFQKEEVGYGIHYPTPLPFLKVYDYKKMREEDFKVAITLSKEIVSLPLYPEMSLDQVSYVSDIINRMR